MEWRHVPGGPHTEAQRKGVDWKDAWAPESYNQRAEMIAHWIILAPKDNKYYIAVWDGSVVDSRVVMGPYDTLDAAKVVYLMTGVT